MSWQDAMSVMAGHHEFENTGASGVTGPYTPAPDASVEQQHFALQSSGGTGASGVTGPYTPAPDASCREETFRPVKVLEVQEHLA